LPSTATRQSFFVYTGDPTNPVPPGNEPALSPRYDLVERVVSYALAPGVYLRPNTHYTAELVVPVLEGDFGFRAFDYAPLDPATTVRLSFLTSNQRKAPGPPEPDGTCLGAVRTFADHCDSSGCHNASDRKMDLDLSDANGVVLTGVGRVAHQAETGPKTGTPLQNPSRFGVAMPRIDPGRPENSYLLYKLVTAPENYWQGRDDPDLCATRHLAPVDRETCVPATQDENDRLRAWFLRGVPMPRSIGDNPPSFLVRSELWGLESWIRDGAACP
jgi:hypothetical protein